MIKTINNLMMVLTLAIVGTSVNAVAQKLSFGYLSYNSILQNMPDYATAKERVKMLREQYDKEAEYNEDKFFKLYSEYIQGQKSFPEEIMLKRQKELQVAMEQGITFRKDAEKLLQKAEAELVKPLEQKLNNAIATVAKERKLSFVANTDQNAYPFINPEEGVDITQLVELVLAGKPLPVNEATPTNIQQVLSTPLNEAK